MVKVNTQSIPSENRIIYKRALQISTLHKETTYVRSRFPWRLPQMQEGGADVKAAQKIQRDRFKYAKNHYALLDATAKARWAAANPEYHSYLFGYNFFMLEGLLGGGPIQYPQMIKTIQVLKDSVPTTGTKSYTINAVDPAKVVVILQGSARKVPRVVHGSDTVIPAGSNFEISPTVDPDKCTVLFKGNSYKKWVFDSNEAGVPVYPYLSLLETDRIWIFWPLTPEFAASISWEITEHIEGPVLPVIVSVAAEAIVIDWAEVPDAAADVSITVVEYL